MAKITPEHYEQWLAENRPEITALESYLAALTPIMHQCADGHTWSAAPSSIKGSKNRKGTGCPHCCGNIPQDYDEWLAENRPGITAIEPYAGACAKILHQCAYGHSWPVSPTQIKGCGTGCPTCDAISKGRHPRGYWTLERCKADAQQYSTPSEWRAGSPSSYSTARQQGWLEECAAHMERLRRDAWTDEEIIADAMKYRTRADWQRDSESGYKASWVRGPEFHERACAHMERVCVQDNDAIYFYEWMENGVGTGIYKVGVTSWRLGDERIRVCCQRNGIDYRLIALCQTSEGDALMFEKALLDMGDIVALPDHIKDGRTEFRIYNDEELGFIYELLGVKEAQAEAA